MSEKAMIRSKTAAMPTLAPGVSSVYLAAACFKLETVVAELDLLSLSEEQHACVMLLGNCYFLSDTHWG